MALNSDSDHSQDQKENLMPCFSSDGDSDSNESGVVEDHGDLVRAPEHPSKGNLKGHPFVDLGLPSGIKWASCNIGAVSAEEFGVYYAWGEIETKRGYDSENCQTYKKEAEWLRTQGYIDSKNILLMSHDVARELWGGTWRMPTRKDIEELLKNTDREWVSCNGVNGIELQSKVNGNRLFIPASGVYDGKDLCGVGERGAFWSASTIDGGCQLSYAAAFTSRSFFKGLYNRALGLNIRPVTE